MIDDGDDRSIKSPPDQIEILEQQSGDEENSSGK
jgi:hypothetical protein